MSKKSILVVKLIVLIVTLIIVVFIAVGITGFISFNALTDFNNTSYSSGNGETTQYDGIESIELNLISLDLSIVESDTEQVSVRDNSIFRGFSLGIRPENKISQNGDSLYFEEGRRWFFNGGGMTGKLEIEVPKGTQIEYDISGVNGKIEISAQAKDELRISNVSGNIEVYTGGEKLNIDTVSGNVECYQPFEEASVNSVSSDIKLTADSSTRRIRADGVSGDVTVEVTDGSPYSADVDGVSSALEDSYNNQSGDESAMSISLNAVSGSLSLEDWQ